MNKETLLIELGTEELPPKTLKILSEAFRKELLSGLVNAELIDAERAAEATEYATPRRLALLVPGVISAQSDQVIERRGPAVQAAFNADGEATPAAMGFAKSCGVDVTDLDRLKTDKGEWLSYEITESGRHISGLVPEILDQAIKRLPIAKRMRWGAGTAEFVRPVQWLVVMHGSQLLKTQVLGIQAGTSTTGHRFHSKGGIELKHADEYSKRLLDDGHVVANFSKRRDLIKQQVNELASSIGGKIQEDNSLLDEVTGLVEYPTAVLGDFDQSFLQVPQECLISSMRDHQKYFHIVTADDKLLPNFITISNIQSKQPDRVRDGNQRVLRARLSDAKFFWDNDKKTKLIDRVDHLENVLFHAKLGNLLDKTKRITSLSGQIAQSIAGDTELAERGALLAKADLISDMVSEFDELQGIMGHYYADMDGEAPIVGESIEQHYWPRFAGDQLPQTAEAQSVALADKLDSLVGIFSSGEIPTGDKDPYGLRRAALSILRILIEKNHALKLSNLVSEASQVYAELQGLVVAEDTQKEIVEFIRGRLTAYYQNQDIPTNTINAVMACKPDSPLDFEYRVKAVHQFSQLAEASDLAAANKRISNILKKQASQVDETIDSNALVEEAEQKLNAAILDIEQQCNALFDKGDYDQGLQILASLRTPVDGFFEHVMVMSEDEGQRRNRLALLNKLRSLFLRVADISQLQT